MALIAGAAAADDEAMNVAYVATGRLDPAVHGDCYVVAVPADGYRQHGSTRVYPLPPLDPGDIDLWQPLVSHDWYSQNIHAHCQLRTATGPAVSLVRLGPWHRGHEVSAGHLAIAFYLDGELLARYGTLDLIGDPRRAERSISHYRVIDRVLGYRPTGEGDLAFEIVTVDGRLLTFDPATGRPQ